MEIKINKKGELQIKRAGKYKNQYCPLIHINLNEARGQIPCNDDCPHFGEPTSYKREDGVTINCIAICKTSLSGTIIDERVKKG